MLLTFSETEEGVGYKGITIEKQANWLDGFSIVLNFTPLQRINCS